MGAQPLVWAWRLAGGMYATRVAKTAVPYDMVERAHGVWLPGVGDSVRPAPLCGWNVEDAPFMGSIAFARERFFMYKP